MAEVAESELVRDPVCGMRIEPQDAVSHQEYKGKTHYFCNPSCAQRFAAEPQKFLKPKENPAEPAAQNVEYIYPMDPEVHKMGPGSCPKCGMALEPATVAAPVTRTEYTCPMHPQIVRSEPGSLAFLQGTFSGDTTLKRVHTFAHLGRGRLHPGIVIDGSRTSESMETVG